MAATATSGRERVRTLNDLLRRHHVGGQVVLTPGVLALGLDLLMLIDDAVSRFEAFTPDNDPYGEHDFGLVRVQGHVVLFKIDARLRSQKPARATAAVRRPLKLFDLRPHHCRWIVFGSGEGALFCGKPKVGTSPYCVEHTQQAWQRLEVKAPARPTARRFQAARRR